MFSVAAEGTLVADGTEQQILGVTAPGRYSGYIDLSEMQVGDTVRIKQYMSVSGVYRSYFTQLYTDIQPDPVVYITPKETPRGIRITAEQTAGVLRSFVFIFIREDLPGLTVNL
jgi:hypothetical protein